MVLKVPDYTKTNQKHRKDYAHSQSNIPALFQKRAFWSIWVIENSNLISPSIFHEKAFPLLHTRIQ
jgi:hypothetical protein